MIELIIVVVLIYIYISPVKGFVKLNDNLTEIKEKLCNFEVEISDELVDENGNSDLIESDFSTFVDLSGLDSREQGSSNFNLSESNYKDFDDIDINL